MRNIHKKLSSSLQIILKVLKMNYKRTKITLLESELKKGFIEDYQPKKHFHKEFISNVAVYSIENKESEKHIIYLHGGAYVLKGNKAHFMFLRKLFIETSFNIHYIDYPLAPESTVVNTIKTVVDVIKALVEKYHIQSVNMIGDSAGGGLCISVSKKIQSEMKVNRLFLFSPWLDLSMKNPEINQLQHTEISLTKRDLLECAKKYSPDNLETKEASPLYLDVSTLFPIDIFAGTDDLLYPDIELFEQKNDNVTLHVYNGAPHVFALFPFIKEQKEIIEFIKNNI